jgi:hypothetical protein
MRKELVPAKEKYPLKRLSRALVAAATLVCCATAGASANIITNGGFETGDFTGWIVTDPSDNTTVVMGVNAGYVANSGNHFALLGANEAGSVTQTPITDTAGQDYTLTYFLASMGDTDTTFSAAWNGVTLPGSQLTNPDSLHAYVEYTFTVTGTGTDTLTFHEMDPPGFLALDDVSLTAAAVPGPIVGAGLPGLILACGGLLALARRRRQLVV